MKETPQDYTKRILGIVEGQNPLKILAGTSKKLDRLIKGVPASKLRKRPAPEKWSVAEILAHLARDPRKCVEQIRLVREGNLALLKSLTPEQWKHHGMHAERGVETIEHTVRMIAGHDINHTRQVERIVAAKKK